MSWEGAVRWLLTQPEHAQLVRDCYYDQPLTEAAERFAASEEWQATRALLPQSGGRALDLGAGQGVSAFALARTGFEVTALEPDPSNLVGCGAIAQLARHVSSPIDAVRGVAEALPFADAAFDLVFCRQALHHARDLRAFCREAARVLRPGGRLIAVREHVISRDEDLQRFRDEHPLHRLYGGESAYRSSEYVRALRDAGLRVVRVLRSFDSPINHAPLTVPGVCEEIGNRLHRIPAAAATVRRISAAGAGRHALLRLASLADRRPGRLYTFVCVK
jgi:SAM-dependent methyltransferase